MSIEVILSLIFLMGLIGSIINKSLLHMLISWSQIFIAMIAICLIVFGYNFIGFLLSTVFILVWLCLSIFFISLAALSIKQRDSTNMDELTKLHG